jgi:hypothetical protein
MNEVFPSLKTASMDDVHAGAIIAFQRSSVSLLAIVTDQLSNGSKSLVLLNKPSQHGPIVTYTANWRNPETVLVYDNGRFEICMDKEKIDPTGRNSWEISGAIVVAGDRVCIRAYDDAPTFGEHRLIDVRTGAVFPNQQSNNAWNFLSWQLWIRDPLAGCHKMLLEFNTQP